MAERKVASLLEAGAAVTVISPGLTPLLAAWAGDGRFEYKRGRFAGRDAAGYLLVLCATDSPEINRLAALEAKQAGALVNVADTPSLCDFTLPARLQRGSLSIAVSTGGQSPALARELRDELAGRYGPEYADYLEMAGRLRLEWQSGVPSSAERCRRWEGLRGFDPEVLELLRQGRKEEAEVRFRDGIGCSGAES